MCHSVPLIQNTSFLISFFLFPQVKYGGHGYAHLLKNIIPKMLDRDIPQDVINEIMIGNPKKWLTFV